MWVRGCQPRFSGDVSSDNDTPAHAQTGGKSDVGRTGTIRHLEYWGYRLDSCQKVEMNPVLLAMFFDLRSQVLCNMG